MTDIPPKTFDDLPDNILIYIFGNLPLKRRFIVAGVSKRWFSLIKNYPESIGELDQIIYRIDANLTNVNNRRRQITGIDLNYLTSLFKRTGLCENVVMDTNVLLTSYALINNRIVEPRMLEFKLEPSSPLLQYLSLLPSSVQYLKIRTDQDKTYTLNEFPDSINLKELDLQNVIIGPALTLPTSLKILTFRYVTTDQSLGLYFDAIRGCPNLEELAIEGSVFNDGRIDQLLEIIRDRLPKLRLIYFISSSFLLNDISLLVTKFEETIDLHPMNSIGFEFCGEGWSDTARLFCSLFHIKSAELFTRVEWLVSMGDLLSDLCSGNIATKLTIDGGENYTPLQLDMNLNPKLPLLQLHLSRISKPQEFMRSLLATIKLELLNRIQLSNCIEIDKELFITIAQCCTALKCLLLFHCTFDASITMNKQTESQSLVPFLRYWDGRKSDQLEIIFINYFVPMTLFPITSGFYDRGCVDDGKKWAMFRKISGSRRLLIWDSTKKLIIKDYVPHKDLLNLVFNQDLSQVRLSFDELDVFAEVAGIFLP